MWIVCTTAPSQTRFFICQNLIRMWRRTWTYEVSPIIKTVTGFVWFSTVAYVTSSGEFSYDNIFYWYERCFFLLLIWNHNISWQIERVHATTAMELRSDINVDRVINQTKSPEHEKLWSRQSKLCASSNPHSLSVDIRDYWIISLLLLEIMTIMYATSALLLLFLLYILWCCRN